MFAGYHGMVGYTLNILYLNLIYNQNIKQKFSILNIFK